MSNNNTMNISPQNISGTCNYKCAYSFKYPTSNSTATNYGTKIELTYEADANPPAKYNNVKMKVDEIMIVSPSVHLFNNANTDAEIIITHTPNNSAGNPLYVCIPINTSGISSKASQIITEIINAVSTGAPSIGERVNQGISSFTLDDIIPMEPFYTYNSDSIDYIAYGLQNAISISADTLKKMQAFLRPYDRDNFKSDALLFLNQDGPTTNDGGGGNEIYIDCNPTGNSEEEEEVTNVNVKSATNNDIGNLFSNPIFTLLLSSVIFVVIILLIYNILTYVTTGSVPTTFVGKRLVAN